MAASCRSFSSLYNINIGPRLTAAVRRGLVTSSKDKADKSVLRAIPIASSSRNSPKSRHQLTRHLSQQSALIGSDYHVRSHRPAIPIPEVSLGEFLMQRLEQHGQFEAVVDLPSQRRLTFNELRDAIIRVTSGLAKLGVKKGDVVCLCLTNCLEYVLALTAVMNLGAIMCPINPASSVGELSRGLKLSGTSVVVSETALSPGLDEACADNTNVRVKVCVGNAVGWVPFSLLTEDDGLSFSGVTKVNPKEDIAFLPFSSGTTGLPKCVMLTHSNILINMLQFQQVCPAEAGYDSVLGYLPFFHAYGLNGKILYSINTGSSLKIMPRFTDQLLDIMERERITILHMVPPVCLFILKHPNIQKFDLSSVRKVFCAAAPLGKEQEDAFPKVTKLSNVIQGFGMTELSPVATMGEEPVKMGSVGQPVSGTTLKVVDVDSGEAVGPNHDGELYVRGPQVMAGYLGNPEATAETLKDGWLVTGDIGHYDEEGQFYVTDRVKELIKYKGSQVAPAELEALLVTHPGVREAAVIGVPDPEAGELPRAYVTKAASDVTEEDLDGYISGQVASHKRLRGGIVFVDAIPKSPSGKILRRELRNVAG